MYTTKYESPLGDIILAAEDDALIGLWLEGQKYFLGSLRERPAVNDGIPIFIQAKQWLNRYFKGDKPDINELKLAPVGSDFRKAVWKLLCEIPYGKVVTYGEIAEQIAAMRGTGKMSAQAVGGAVGHNPISIIIPCHRVVGADGSLTGYAGGIDKKLRLLKLEGADMDRLYVPKKGTAL
jgi:methylated-DNA-[protein]-cysteine S-methyltransferase